MLKIARTATVKGKFSCVTVSVTVGRTSSKPICNWFEIVFPMPYLASGTAFAGSCTNTVTEGDDGRMSTV